MMKLKLNLLLLAATSMLLGQSLPPYPKATRSSFVETYFDKTVPDPYRWMEDTQSAELKTWIEEQNKLSNLYFSSIPQRAAIKNRLLALSNYEKYSLPSRIRNKYFYSYNSGLQPHAVWYVAKSIKDQGTVLLDPNIFSSDGTISLGGMSISKNAQYLAYATSDGGSDWRTWYVRDIETKKDLADKIEWSKFSGATWSPRNDGFFYGRYEKPSADLALKAVNQNQKIYFHRLNTPQSEDLLIYERPDHPEWGFSTSVTDDGRYLIIYQSEGTQRKNRVFIKDLSKANAEVTPFLDTFDASYSIVGNNKETFFVLTSNSAPRNRLVAISLAKPHPSHWKTLISENPNGSILQDVSFVHQQFVAQIMTDAQTSLIIYDSQGKLQSKITMPSIGSVSAMSGDPSDSEGFYTFSSFNRPATAYRYDFKTQVSTPFRTPKISFSPDDFVTKQVFVPSKDGTRVPIFISHKKGLKISSETPLLLYGYGGFNISSTPSFSVPNLVWMEMGGIYVLACIRGGGEYGQSWHDQGKLINKQNVFDDFIATAEFLIRENYTSSPKLAIRGGSNGGLLVGASMTQRPDLFGACIPQVGVMDMLRYHKFTIGWAWKSDYMSSETAEGFENLMSYSPLHKIKDGVKYPPTLITTAERDDRVFPAHSYKFGAQLQYSQASENPVLMRIETRAGHGAGKSMDMAMGEYADMWGFLLKSLRMELAKDFPR